MPFVPHQPVSSLGALITSVSYEEKFNAKRYRGLPNVEIVAGPTKIASLTLEGYLTKGTGFPSIPSATDLKIVTLSGGGKSVTGPVTALTLKGTQGSPITFSITVEGVGGSSGGGGSGGSTELTGSDLIFMEQATISAGMGTATVLSFSLSASWDIFWVYPFTTGSFPNLNESILRGFEGTLTVDANAIASLGNTLGEITFSISTTGPTISGKGYLVGIKQADSADDFLKGSNQIMITSLEIG